MTAAGRAYVCFDSVTGCNFEAICELGLLADCYICLHATVLVKIKLGWLTAISFEANIITVQPRL